MKEWVMREEKRKTLPEPNWDRDIHDPFLMKNMERAARRVLAAMRDNERIIIFGDYDADGVPGAAILYRFLQKIGYSNFEEYIPDRYNEEYGLSLRAMDEFASANVKLIITVDCGITDVAEAARAAELGMDVIITDHHIPQENRIPPAYAIINPKQAGDDYPFKYPCGAGVAFKLVQAIIRASYQNLIGWEKWLLDLVAISTVADMVPLTEENRVFVYYGLRVLQKTKNLGLKLLMEALKINPRYVTEDDISFLIAPRINAASRMSHASEAFYLLTTESEEEAKRIIAHLEEKNIERRALVEKILSGITHNDKTVMVTGQDDWAVGVLGLTANRLMEQRKKTVCLWAVNRAGKVKGSCRSDGTVDIVEMLTAAGGPNFFIDFGGHKFSGGFSLERERVGDLDKKINEAYIQVKVTENSMDKLYIDEEVTLDNLSSVYKEVVKFAPFGAGNPKPVFVLKNLEIKNSKTIGNGGLHLQIDFKNSHGKTVSATGFFMTHDKFPGIDLSLGQRIDLAANLERTHFRGFPELRLRILDIKQAL